MSRFSIERGGNGPFNMKTLKKVGGLTAGLAVSTCVNSFLQKKSGVNGDETMLGLSGDTSGYVIPAAIAILGLLGSRYVNDDFAKNICYGAAAGGFAGIVNKVANKSIVALSGDDGKPLPGLGATETAYQQLPVYSGTPQEAYQTYDTIYETSNDSEAPATEEAGETMSGVDDSNFFIA